MTLPWIMHLWRTQQRRIASDRAAALQSAAMGACAPHGAARAIQKTVSSLKRAAGEPTT